MKVINVYSKVKEAIIHPFAFAVFPVLSLYVKNMGQGFFREAIGITTGVFIFAALLWLFVGLFIKDRKKSAIVVSAFFVLFFSYGHAISAFSTLLERMHLLDKARFLVEGKSALHLWLVIWGVLFVVVSYFVVKLANDLRVVTKFLNVVALTLMVMVGVNFADGGLNMYLPPRMRAKVDEGVAHRDSDQTNANMHFRQFLPLLARNYPDVSAEGETIVNEFISSWQEDVSAGDTLSGSSPDIYYIIVDAYARADILEEVYQFDNSEFLSYLAEKGFYVADKSRANYPQTALSLSSSLNFMYLDDLVDQIGTGTSNRQPLQVMIRNSKVFQYLRNYGYTIFAFSSGYGPTEITNADVYMIPPKRWNLSEFQEALIVLTPLSTFQKVRADSRRDRITYAFDHIADATRVDGPTFVFAHITAPHFPFIFDADGKPIQPKKGIGAREDYEYDEYIQGYNNQLIFVTKRLRIAIDEILSQSPDPPIIIVQADHGPCARLAGWDVQNAYLPERMSIFNAYYFPDQDYKALYEDITPVNTFRVVLNNYFGTDYELLEDKCYFSSWNHPYLLTDVTDDSRLDHSD